nr:hypothetical protein Iba_chr11aCG4050 [Ipomoea batatas]GMD58508.1 hypothetical protein Iba_chr11fCG6220 [Ipomoea batatas]
MVRSWYFSVLLLLMISFELSPLSFIRDKNFIFLVFLRCVHDLVCGCKSLFINYFATQWSVFYNLTQIVYSSRLHWQLTFTYYKKGNNCLIPRFVSWPTLSVGGILYLIKKLSENDTVV